MNCRGQLRQRRLPCFWCCCRWARSSAIWSTRASVRSTGHFLRKRPSRWARLAAAWPTPLPARVLILLIASAMGVPIGIGAGIYLAEYGQNRFGDLIRFTADVLNGVPSIVVGIVAYGHCSADAGTFFGAGRRSRPGHYDDSHHHPHHRRDASSRPQRGAGSRLRPGRLRAGARRSRSLCAPPPPESSPVLCWLLPAWRGRRRRCCSPLLAISIWNWKINQPTAALSLQIFTYAISPFDEWHRQAWAGALILIVLIVVSVSAVRIAASRGMLKGAN